MEAPLTTRAALLLALREAPGYGLDLIRRVEQRTAGRVRLSAARVYPALKSFERERLVRRSVVVPRGRRGARSRTYYHLTRDGVTASSDCRATLAALVDGRPRLRLSAAARKRMAERLLVADELSTTAAALAEAARKAHGRR